MAFYTRELFVYLSQNCDAVAMFPKHDSLVTNLLPGRCIALLLGLKPPTS